MKECNPALDYCKISGSCDGSGCMKLRDEDFASKRTFVSEIPQTYNGIRFTADASDCAMPIAMDSHSGCSFVCLYCFSNNLQRDLSRNESKKQSAIKHKSIYTEMPIRKLERLLSGKSENKIDVEVYKLLQKGQPLQWGALGDPFDDIERATGWGLKAIELLKKYNIPTRISTKGTDVLMLKEYRKAFKGCKNFWFAFSIISANDELLRKVDITAPNATDRLKCMKQYTKDGHIASLRFRPFLVGISDKWKGEPEGWKVLIYKAANAGASVVSFEWAFWNNAPTDCQKTQYRMINKVQGDKDFYKKWKKMSYGKESCLRGDRSYQEELTYAIREYTHKLGLIFVSSDPHFKELSDSGNCCGMMADDPIWGGYSKNQWCELVVKGRKHYDKTGKKLKFYKKDWLPEGDFWMNNIKQGSMIATGGCHDFRVHKNQTFGDSLHNKWNTPLHPRAPWKYFQGILIPIGTDENNDVIYQYEPYKRKG